LTIDCLEDAQNNDRLRRPLGIIISVIGVSRKLAELAKSTGFQFIALICGLRYWAVVACPLTLGTTKMLSRELRTKPRRQS
jgi:hypothetical protein